MSEIEGTNEVLRLFDRLLEPTELKASMGIACALVEGEAKKNAPKKLGTLRNSIVSKVTVEDGQVKGVVYTPLEYAPYVEYGTGLFAENGGRTDVPWKYQDDKGNWHSTRGQKPHPYLRPALTENIDKIKRILGGAIE